jgi:5'-nucleotidase
VGTFFKGEQMIPVLNACNIDASCIGNHDFDYGLEALIELKKKSNCPWLLSNMLDKVTTEPLADAK